MDSKKHLEDFYNYKYWREIQTNQLNNATNIIFTFTVAIIVFTINYLLNNNTCPIITDFLFISITIYSISIFFYFLMNIIKLIDYRKTASLIKSNVSLDEIGKKTYILGQIIWFSFILETVLTFLGLIISIITFKSLILK